MPQYIDWTQLDDDHQTNLPESDISLQKDSAVCSRSLQELLLREDVPDTLKQLINQHQHLQKQLNSLTGQVAPADHNDWDRRRFAFPQHTATSRLRDKRQAREELQLSVRRKRALEDKKCAQRGLERRQQQAEQHKRQRLSQAAVDRKHDIGAEQQKRKRLNQSSIDRRREIEAEHRLRLLRLYRIRQQKLKVQIQAERENAKQVRRRAQHLLRKQKQAAEERRQQQQRFWQEWRKSSLHQHRQQQAEAELSRQQRLKDLLQLRPVANRMLEYQDQARSELQRQRALQNRIMQQRQEADDDARRQRALQRAKARRAEQPSWGGE